MISSFYFLWKRELFDRYPNPWAIVGELAMCVLGLMVYWYTSSAFVPVFSGKLDPISSSYFNYLLIGELTLFVPLVLLHGVLRLIRKSISDGTFEMMLVMPHRPQTPILLMGTAMIFREMISVLVLFMIAVIAFGFRVKGPLLGAALILQLVSLPAFFGLGLLACSILIFFGRGESFISHLTTLAAVFAGVYFPISVFPGFLQHFSRVVSPFSLLLENTRVLLSSGWNSEAYFQCLGFLGVWGVCLFSAGYLMLGFSLAAIRRKGMPLILGNG